MNENEWTKTICDKLQDSLPEKKLYAETLQKVPYLQEIDWYTDEWEPEYRVPAKFETDLLIYEKENDKIVPRVIVEAKLKSITTHDAIAYSYKAEKHKNITPYLRYGVMLGDRNNAPLPGRLYRHGTNFDFMFSFSKEVPSTVEWDAFIKMIIKEVKYSRVMEEMLHESRNKDRKHYFMLQRQLIVKEMSEMNDENF